MDGECPALFRSGKLAHPTRFERVTFAFGVLRLAACQHRRAPDLDYLGARQLVTEPVSNMIRLIMTPSTEISPSKAPCARKRTSRLSGAIAWRNSFS